MRNHAVGLVGQLRATRMSAAVSMLALLTGSWLPVLAEAETVWPDSAVPAVATATDTNAVELGVKFRPSVDGLVTGVRFYKGPTSTGTHVGSLWSSSGSRLATATFANETASGWQQVNFGTPVAVSANTVYVVSYFAPSGRYSYDRNYFLAGGTSAGSLYLLRDGESGGNGLYGYGSVSTFPINSYRSTNYWVDVVFEAGTPPPRNCNANPVAAENCLEGNPSAEWEVTGSGDPSIQGFATSFSVDQGETIAFKVKTDATSYRLDIYRLGHYDGLGARRVATLQPSAGLPQAQPNCLYEPSTGLIDCGNWGISASWAVPVQAVSGVYIARLVRTDTGGASHIPFIVRDDSGSADILFKTADTAWQAYNSYAGNSLYTGQPANRAYKVSYNRPFNTRGLKPESYLFNAEYPMIRWLEANGYDVSYTSGADADRRGALISSHRVFMSNGHDEYWSAIERSNVEAARDAGVHLAFFSGNEMFWKTRWENSIDGSGSPYRTLVCYKETHANAKIDPDAAWTGTWRDPRFSPPSDGGRPENALTGTIFKANATASIVVPAADGRMRFWRNTSAAVLADGTSATMPAGTLGYEWDEDADNGFRPRGLVRLSTAIVVNVPVLQDHGSNYANGTATHSLTLYKASSGALVFGAGTMQWAWGLDSFHDRGSTPADVRMQQATVNLLADMGVQPGTLQGSLAAAFASTDAMAPTSLVSTPAAGSNVPIGSLLTISGSASDTGGGVVGGVEVSVDGGATWRRASGRTTWSYGWTPSSPGQVRLLSRAVDDSGNVESPGVGVLVNVTVTVPGACPCSVWSPADVPAVAASTDTRSVELGVKFRSTVNGFVTGIRFYKGVGNSGTHTGSLWSSSGVRLATATFVNESASGWQQVNFATPVPISANTVYVASYFAPQGRYSYSRPYFSAGITRGPLYLLRDGESGGNGVYAYGSSSLFPSGTYGSSNYWVDVVFE